MEKMQKRKSSIRASNKFGLFASSFARYDDKEDLDEEVV